jgi:hypothetical protein
LNSPLGRTLLVAAGFVLAATSTLFAQTGDGGPDPASVRVRLGPLWMNPGISLPNLGVDTNVFNDPTSVVPRRDVTMTINPSTDLWLKLGRTWLSGNINEDIVWYQTYASQRSTNNTFVVGWKAPLNRLVLTSSARWVRTRSRPGFEIDARAQRNEPAYAASAEIRGFAKTFIGVRGGWSRVDFADSAVFNGSSLQDQLDRTTRSAAITVRHELTPLTSITLSGGRTEERFLSAVSRNSTSDDYSIAINLDPAALFKGSARIGYTIYKTEAADLADYKGTTAAANLAYTLLGSTRFAINVTRAVESSYDINQPYYLLGGIGASLAQQVFGPVDVVGRFGAERLEYRSRTGAAVAAANRIDHVRSFGGGLGFRMGQELRLGFNIDKERRTSVLTDREFEGLKYGMSLTYGL